MQKISKYFKVVRNGMVVFDCHLSPTCDRGLHLNICSTLKISWSHSNFKTVFMNVSSILWLPCLTRMRSLPPFELCSLFFYPSKQLILLPFCYLFASKYATVVINGNIIASACGHVSDIISKSWLLFELCKLFSNSELPFKVSADLLKHGLHLNYKTHILTH